MKTKTTIVLGILLGALHAVGQPSFVSAHVGQVLQADVLEVNIAGQTEVVRLYGIDCPEPGQPHAQDALDFVTGQVLGKDVSVAVRATDNEGKKVVEVLLPSQVNLNLTLLEKGLAWWDERNAPNDSALKRLTAKAIAAKAGLWSDPAPLAPWDYRASHLQPDFQYSVSASSAEAAPTETQTAEHAQNESKQETKTISAKGNEQYRGNFTVNPADLKQYESINPMDLVAKHRPRIATDTSGKPLGLTADAISSLPLASQFGLQDGDIISSVNGIPITSEADIFALANRLKGEKNFSVTVLRGGQPFTIQLSLP